MKNDKAYCLVCDKEVKFIIKNENEQCRIRGVDILYSALKAYCPVCNKDLFVSEFEKINRINRFDEYKKQNGLLTSQDIIAIRNKYGLSQTKLANVIMCGEKNIARYETGTIQDRHIDLLLRILDEHPEYFGLKIKKEKPKRVSKLSRQKPAQI